MDQNILLVDDDELLLETYKAILEIDGYKVHEALNPYKALQIIDKQEIQLAILDYNLPYMTGIQLGHLINKTQADTKIMFISGNSMIHEISKEADFMVHGVLSKPIAIEHLMGTVKNLTSETNTPHRKNKPKVETRNTHRIREVVEPIISKLNLKSLYNTRINLLQQY